MRTSANEELGTLAENNPLTPTVQFWDLGHPTWHARGGERDTECVVVAQGWWPSRFESAAEAASPS